MSRIRADLSGKVAIVTGGSGGLGYASAAVLAEAGATVEIWGRDESKLRQAFDRLRGSVPDAGGGFTSVDVAAVARVWEGVERARDKYGRIDILVTSAGINITKPALELTEDDWDRVLDTNLKGTFFCCQAVAPVMIDQGVGRIVNISSQMAHVAYYKRAAYCSSKGGVAQLTKELAIEWAPHITVNAVAATFIETEMTRPMFEDAAFKQDVLSRIPLGRLGRPEDVADAVLYLASDAANMVTGHSLLVDGGWTAW